MPRQDNNILWADHYHFVKDDNYINKITNKIEPTIIFHKTIEDHILQYGPKNRIDCFFHDNI